jgi:hypothetical protein
MSETNPISAWSRGRLIAILVSLLAISLAFGIKAAAAQACAAESGFCTWTGTFYGGGEVDYGCVSLGQWVDFNSERNSAKNRCPGQYYRIGWTPEGGSTSWKVCLSPGGERPEPGRFNTFERVAGC